MFNVPPTAFQLARARAAREFSYMWVVIGFVVVVICAMGGTFGWINYFHDDDFTPQFDSIRRKNAALQGAIDRERNERIAEDAVLTTEQEALQVALDLEIATRTAQDALLLALITAEIAARTAAQAALNASLTLEIETREAFDTLAFGELANLTIRLNALLAYNVFAQQEFIEVYNNLTLLETQLTQEIADRLASEAILAAQDLAQQNFIFVFANELAAEIAIRTAQGEAQLAEINAFLGTGILTLNNQSALNHNFDFVSANPGFTIGSGGTNIITITNHAIVTVDGVTPDPTTFDISILADNNVVLTPGVNSLTFSLAALPPTPNYATYNGNWAAATSGTCNIPANFQWLFDAYDIAGSMACVTASPFITNYNTYNGFGWEVPLSGGVGYGIWFVRVRMVLTVNYVQTPYGAAMTMGFCIDTRANCIANPNNNEPQASFVWQMFSVHPPSDFCGQGMCFQDHAFKGTHILDGRGLAAGTGLYPVWQYWQPSGQFAGPLPIPSSYLYAISVEYDVVQLA
jgi:hypothetical protein